MKTFDQLTKEQRVEAIRFAKEEIKKLASAGIIHFENSDSIPDSTLEYYAIAAAEGSFYSEKGDTIVEGIVE